MSNIAVLVINERDRAFHWTSGKRGQADKQIAPGEVAVLSESEWNEVPISLRGPGGLRPLDPSPQDEDSLNVTEMDYVSVDADIVLRFLGEAPSLVPDPLYPSMGHDDPLVPVTVDDTVWTLKRFSYDSITAPGRITGIQILNGVAFGPQGDAGTGYREGLSWVL